MKTMAILAILTGVVLAANGSIEGWAGGVLNHDGLSITAATLSLVAGVLLVVVGVGLLRQAGRAAARAQVGAIACLAIFALLTVALPRMSLFTTFLGIGFPIALLLFLRLTRGRLDPTQSRQQPAL